MNRRSFILTFLLVVLMLAFFFSSNKESFAIIEEVEIREYEGKDLSSIEDFRENSIAGPQYVDLQNYNLVVNGLVENEVEFEYEQIVNDFESVKKVITLYCVEGWSVRILWEGVYLEDIFNISNINSSANTVIFYAYDGYSTALPLDYILDNQIIIAYKMNNVTLPPERGFPFQLVAESKYGYKWIKWITKIELSNDADYLGYWESRGYPNDAELSSDSGRPAPTTDFGNLPNYTPNPTQTPTPTPNPTPTPTTSVEPSNTPDLPSSPSPTGEIDIPIEIPATILIIAVGIVFIFIIKRK